MKRSNRRQDSWLLQYRGTLRDLLSLFIREIVRRDNSFQPLIIQMVDLYDNVASSLRTIFYIILRLNGPFPLLER